MVEEQKLKQSKIKVENARKRSSEDGHHRIVAAYLRQYASEEFYRGYRGKDIQKSTTVGNKQSLGTKEAHHHCTVFVEDFCCTGWICMCISTAHSPQLDFLIRTLYTYTPTNKQFYVCMYINIFIYIYQTDPIVLKNNKKKNKRIKTKRNIEYLSLNVKYFHASCVLFYLKE